MVCFYGFSSKPTTVVLYYTRWSMSFRGRVVGGHIMFLVIGEVASGIGTS